MRKLSGYFMNCLTSGFLQGLKEMVKKDRALNLELRDNFMNIYFKGHSLLQLSENGISKYMVSIHHAFK
jgi:hypothetical protein